ncbi:MAG: SDR family oxidoreductase, partial [Pseudomonadota bacterium]
VIALDLEASFKRHALGSSVTCIAVDATRQDSLEDAAQTIRSSHGAIDGFVNLCGFADEDADLMDRSEASWRAILDVNLNAAFFSAIALAPLIQPGGSIVQMGSDLGLLPRPGYGPYAISKAGISMLTRQLASELAPGIRVNCVSSTAVDTEFLRGGTGHAKGDEPLRLDVEAYAQQIPLKRIAKPADISGPILFLLSDAAAYMTGQTLHVNGGRFMAV